LVYAPIVKGCAIVLLRIKIDLFPFIYVILIKFMSKFDI
jgi:hypothetical protein